MASYTFILPIILCMFCVLYCVGRSIVYEDDDDYDYDIVTEPPKRVLDMSACEKPCLNNGTCVEPGVCQCPENIAGTQCELDYNWRCEKLDSFENAYLMCSDLFNTGDLKCYVSCDSGYKTIDGRPATYLTCLNKKWYMKSRKDGKLYEPKCQNPNVIEEASSVKQTKNETICNPPCQNNGICSESGVCQCPENVKGTHCELDFNSKCDESGQLGEVSYINCANGQIKNDKSVRCQIYCLDGMFESDLYCLNKKWNMKTSESEDEYKIPTKCEDLRQQFKWKTTSTTAFADQSTTLYSMDYKTSEYDISSDTPINKNDLKTEVSTLDKKSPNILSDNSL
ncbi:uncharacterized protein LOC129951275 [Eupeodes corollae]|uniref:uncharacterized protein LOC129951275 n=1 Tax=Eupeodes corollae TaxID=290404 RepID=UPI0024934740|nr:uncharacterized protein LOC129951275 [Eupeodes corollae]